ncbi:MAG: hypothetical protein A49_32120 [Methyloceanibacter sp.]|nr:MAG: hypothetical protein A49_32120 [Methyloceanibacter sp.]
MRARTVLGGALAIGALAAGTFTPLEAPASTADGYACLAAAQRVDDGEVLTEAEKKDAHEACSKALGATASVIQKYQFEEAIFAITGKRHEY